MSSNLDRICAGCRKPQDDNQTPFKKCGGCKTKRYCSTSCQQAHWKTHKPACLAVRAARAAREAAPQQQTGFDLPLWDRWRKTRKFALLRLYTTSFATHAAEAGLICLNVFCRPDSDPALDGFRAFSIFARTIDVMASIVPSFGVDELRAMSQNLPLGQLVAPIILHLRAGEGQDERQRSYIMSTRFPAYFYDEPHPHLPLEQMLFNLNDSARTRY